jgi:alkanesulfonate monooxygenase SsuD/methylene tetrahydromethanopterin reductase-like flavin-dependent oxidoreductase (luciferase family)
MAAATPQMLAPSVCRATTSGTRLLDIGRSTTFAAASDRERASRNSQRGTKIESWSQGGRMTRVQFGFCLPGELRHEWRVTFLHDLNRALDRAAVAFDSAWMVDHLQFGDAGVLEGFTTLAYVAARHPWLQVGHAVLCQSFRNPALLAKMAATLQFVGDGRFTLGLGAGWHAEEHRAYGYDFPPAHVRVEQLDEALQIIKALWTENTVTFEGKHYRVVEAHCEPKPDPIPAIMVGAFKPRMLRLTAMYADRWNVSSTGPATYRHLAEEFERACAEVGRDPTHVRRSWIGGCACARTREDAEAIAGARVSSEDDEDFDFVGTPQQLVEQMRPFVEVGVDYFMVDCMDFPRLTGLELIINEVVPALQG